MLHHTTPVLQYTNHDNMPHISKRWKGGLLHLLHTQNETTHMEVHPILLIRRTVPVG